MTDPLVQRVLDLAEENLLVRDRSADLEAAIADGGASPWSGRQPSGAIAA